MPSFILNPKVYEFVKWVVMIVLPAFNALYFSLAELYDWSNGAQVVGTISIVTVFLGAILGISSKNFNSSDAKYDGVMNMVPDEDGDRWVYDFVLNDDVTTLSDKKDIAFKVNQPDPA
jgi:Putative phage holin Dp-1